MVAPSIAFMPTTLHTIGLRRPAFSTLRAVPTLRMSKQADKEADDACEKVVKVKPHGSTTDDDDIDEDALAQCIIASEDAKRSEVSEGDKKKKVLTADESY